MKASLDENGQLNVRPENGTEAFALRQWREAYMDQSSIMRPVLSVGNPPDSRFPEDTEIHTAIERLRQHLLKHSVRGNTTDNLIDMAIRDLNIALDLSSRPPRPE